MFVFIDSSKYCKRGGKTNCVEDGILTATQVVNQRSRPEKQTPLWGQPHSNLSSYSTWQPRSALGWAVRIIIAQPRIARKGRKVANPTEHAGFSMVLRQTELIVRRVVFAEVWQLQSEHSSEHLRQTKYLL